MRIGLSFDLKKAIPVAPSAPEDALEEYDSLETIEILEATLEAEGHSVVRLGGGREFLENVLREKVDFVFNIAEGRGSHRSREAQVPSVLEMLGIPYSASDPLCLAVCLDKHITKKTVLAGGVCTPNWRLIRDKDEISEVSWNQFPLPAIVKPAYEGSSMGVHSSSLAFSPKEIVAVVSQMLDAYHQPIMAEEFIEGDEVTVGIVGNSPPRVLGMMRILPRVKNSHFIYSVEAKRDYLNLIDYECPAQLPAEVLERITQSSLRAFEVLECRDFARLDFRVSPEGIPYFLEINPLPGLGTYSDLVIMAQMMGWTHQGLISAIFNAALKRYPQCVRV